MQIVFLRARLQSTKRSTDDTRGGDIRFSDVAKTHRDRKMMFSVVRSATDVMFLHAAAMTTSTTTRNIRLRTTATMMIIIIIKIKTINNNNNHDNYKFLLRAAAAAFVSVDNVKNSSRHCRLFAIIAV